MYTKFAFLVGLYAAMIPVSSAETILVLGDSLSAAYGIDQQQSWVQLLADRVEAEGYHYRIVNISISGETTIGGRMRIDNALTQHRPRIVIVELGANDGLRGLPLDQISSNLSVIIERSQNAKAQVLLIGMRLPPNYGPLYTHQFSRIFRKLAQHYSLALVPFLLDGVAGNDTRMQSDGLHPRASAQKQILSNVWPVLVTLLDSDSAG